jgi:hypothetical protein
VAALVPVYKCGSEPIILHRFIHPSPALEGLSLTILAFFWAIFGFSLDFWEL